MSKRCIREGITAEAGGRHLTGFLAGALRTGHVLQMCWMTHEAMADARAGETQTHRHTDTQTQIETGEWHLAEDAGSAAECEKCANALLLSHELIDQRQTKGIQRVNG